MLRKRVTRIIRTVVFIGICLIAQMSEARRLPEARTPEEFDLYLQFHEASDAKTKHMAGLRFEQAYPDSQLLIYVYQSELEYARSRNLYQDAIAAGEKALRAAPADIKALIGMAEILPHNTDDRVALSRAEEYARRVLKEVNRLELSYEVPLQECEEIRRFLQSRAYAALGYVVAKRGKLAQAIEEFERAVATSPDPVGVQLFRLGKLYRAARREREATEMFQRASKAGPADITLLAESELKKGK